MESNPSCQEVLVRSPWCLVEVLDLEDAQRRALSALPPLQAVPAINDHTKLRAAHSRCGWQRFTLPVPSLF